MDNKDFCDGEGVFFKEFKISLYRRYKDTREGMDCVILCDKGNP